MLLVRQSFLLRRYPRRICGPSRHYTTGPPLAFVFDIDGVMLRGEDVIPQARRALDVVHGNNPWKSKIPFILMTNGGGLKESLRATLLSRQLGYEIRPDQYLQSHTVLRSLANDAEPSRSRSDSHILVIGGVGDSVRDVAESYGFKNVHTSLDVLAWNPSIWPFHQLSDSELDSTRNTDFSRICVDSIFVFHDPRNWALDIQVMTDVIRSYPNSLGLYNHSISSHGVDLHFTNPDLLWRAHYQVPRFGQGAFRQAFQAVFTAATGAEYPYIQYGKPSRLTYDYGISMLKAQYSNQTSHPSKIFMVGDNPESDVAGANGAGWYSLLVETGVYDPSLGPPTHTPTAIVRDVEEAVHRAIEIASGE